MTLSDRTHDAVTQAAKGRPVGQFVSDALESQALAGDIYLQGLSLDHRIEHLVDAKLKSAVGEKLKDQTLVELETAELVAERAIKWAKIVGVFLAIPAALFVALFSFLGVKTYFDLRDVAGKISDAESTVKLAKELSDQSQATSRELIERTNQLRPSVAEAEAIVDRLHKLEEQVPVLEARQSGLEEQVETLAGRVKLGSAESDLEGPFRRYLARLDTIGFPAGNSETKIERTEDKSKEDNTYYDDAEHTLFIGRKFWNSLSAAFAEYTHTALFEVQPKSKSSYGSNLAVLERACADYFSSSFLNEPRVGLGVDPSLTGGKEFLRTLANNLTFADLPVGEPPEIFRDAPIWGGLFWELRRELGTDNSDTAVFEAWRDLPNDVTDQTLYVRFSALLFERALAKARTEGMKNAVRAVWQRRSFPMTSP